MDQDKDREKDGYSPEEEFTQRDPPPEPASYQTPGETAGDASRAQADVTPLGIPRADHTVRSTYDSRPVDAFDFNVVLTNEPASPGLNTYNFIVPLGYTAVLREFRLFFDPVPVVGATDVTALILRNGNGYSLFQGNPASGEFAMGDGTNFDPIKLFMTADENDSIGVTVDLNVAIPIGTDIFVHFHGNLLTKNSTPHNLNIANAMDKPFPQRFGESVRPLPPTRPETRPQVIPQPVKVQAKMRPLTLAAPVCLPGEKLMRVTVNGREEIRCVKVLGQSKSGLSNLERIARRANVRIKR